MADNLIGTGNITYEGQTSHLVSFSFRKVITPTDYVMKDDDDVYWRVTGIQYHYEIEQTATRVYNNLGFSGGKVSCPSYEAAHFIILERPNAIALADIVNLNEHDGWELREFSMSCGDIDRALAGDNYVAFATGTVQIVTKPKVNRDAYLSEKLEIPTDDMAEMDFPSGDDT
jgi:hypothetical protein